MPALVDQTITVYRGEAVQINFTMNPPENITGYTLMFTVTKAANKTTKLLGPLEMTHADDGIGLFNITLTEEQTNLIPAIDRFDVWRTDEGLEQPYAIGNFVVLGNSRVPPVDVPA